MLNLNAIHEDSKMSRFHSRLCCLSRWLRRDIGFGPEPETHRDWWRYL